MILPEAFETRTRNLLGNEFEEFEKALKDIAPTSVRVNNKIDYQPSQEKVAWCNTGFYLSERPLFTADPLFHAGVYYVQEASSMFLAQAVEQFFPNAHTVLDLCAAPGGKSTLLSQALPSESLLVSNEIIRSRAYILAENIVKWGNPNCVVTNNEPKDFDKLPGFFDALVVDAPCSGEGMFRKDPGAIQEWSEYNVKLCAERQREILSSVWESLKEDGILVYSTCTYNREENEDNVQWICNELGAELLRVDISAYPKITESDFGYRFYPHKTKGEGFFISVLKKTTVVSRTLKNKKDDKKGIKFVINENIKSVSLLDAEKWGVLQEGNLFKAYNKLLLSEFQLLNSTLKCMYSGILLGELKGKDFIPAAEIAFSKVLDRSMVETVDVDYETAIQYLRKDAIYLEDYNRGYLLITYKGLALGWVKNMGNRCNNLYPQEWRIRMKI
jgi:tRNA and rRNA cytosine-C5-methylases